ncbi:MAG: PDDEXK nuclease domain-containing protein [Spirochaetaceae bacterium]|jgi:predicted nuclease of restriction endonuclease-like (RecB) superfamily|nr:PDDEXK nuclease domain-containing protein [Spirochaetaceae bacterium]
MKTAKYIKEIKQIIEEARKKAYSAVNFVMVEAYWLIGQRIVVEEQHGKERAEYGKQVIKEVSEALTEEYGEGYSETSVRNFRFFYISFKDYEIQQAAPAKSLKQNQQALPAKLKNKKGQAVSDLLSTQPKRIALLSWTHYEKLMRVENKKARDWYMREAAEQMWSYRTLARNISTQYYERLLASQAKEPVITEMQEKTKDFQKDKLEFIKNPSVLEFLGLPGKTGYSEQQIEDAIIRNLQDFILELGKGFAFVERQQLIRTEAQDYYIDLVFYNFILKCFVLIDLKIGKITHQDVGQMDMYVRMYDELKRGKGDGPSIGIVLCSQTDNDIAKYSILKGNERLFATKYKLYLPTEEELRAEIEKSKADIKEQLLKKGKKN